MERSKTNGDLVEGTIATRMTKGSAKVETKLTLDFTGVTREELIDLATPTLVIDNQAVYRNGSIPASDVVKVKEFLARPRGAGGFKATPENMAARIGKQERPDFIKTCVLLGMDEKAANKLADAKFGKQQ
jgi:hypothetical protein